MTIIGEFHYFPLPARLLPMSYLTDYRHTSSAIENSVRKSTLLLSWSGYHRHDLCCASDPRKVPQTSPGSLHDYYRPNLRLCSQGRSLEGSEEDWMSGQVRQHCEILPRWHDGMCYHVSLMMERCSHPLTSHMARTMHGCVLVPLLFSIFAATMLVVAFKDCGLGVSIQFRTDNNNNNNLLFIHTL